jgi:LysR family transcriptional regulator, glycine cleavage system transcriptional activator
MYGRTVADALPPLNALRAFEAAARHGSFTRAAAELHVTQTAVSHQMRHLESFLGLRLFLRLPRRLVLTAEGQAYARDLARVFERIADATRALDTRPRRELLAVTSLPSFAARWLVPRLASFTAAHPQIDLRLVATERPVDLARESVDLGIRFGYGRYPGLQVEKLMDDQLLPVCSPRLRTRALDLRRLPLLHDDSPDGWRRWLRATGRADVDPERGHVFTDASMMLQAAVDGHGVAMARWALAETELAAGRLVRPFPGTLPCEHAYYLVTAEATAGLARVQAFRRWLLDQVAATAANRSTLGGDGSSPPTPRRRQRQRAAQRPRPTRLRRRSR